MHPPLEEISFLLLYMLEKKGFEVRFKTGVVTIGKEGRVVLKGTRIDDMYTVIINNKSISSQYIFVSTLNTTLL
jgi:hypothetical protein